MWGDMPQRSEVVMRSRNRERGQAIVESGLILMVFLPVLIGIFDFGQFLYLHQSLAERVRAAARYGAVHTYTDGSDSVNLAIYNDPAGATDGATALLPNLQSTSSTGDGYVSATLSGAGTDDAFITVTITNYPYYILWMANSLNRRTLSDTEPYEIGR
jgi:Flp pilus assembly protein TadG